MGIFTSKPIFNEVQRYHNCYECAECIHDYEYTECFNCRIILHLKCVRDDYRCNSCNKEYMLYKMRYK